MALTRKPLSLKARALQALALREHSRSELHQKLLRPRGLSGAASPSPRRAVAPSESEAGPQADDEGSAEHRAAQVEALLDELQAQGLLSAERFIESRVHARSARFGNRRIQAELARHGLQVDEHTAEQLRATEYERARAVWVRRYGRASEATQADADVDLAHAGAPRADAAETARQMRFLAARGFSAEVIRRVVKGAPNEE